jgi:hypothetical protein
MKEKRQPEDKDYLMSDVDELQVGLYPGKQLLQHILIP